jgi:hypothetical protein
VSTQSPTTPDQILDRALPEIYPDDGEVYLKQGGFGGTMMHSLRVPDARLPFVAVSQSQAASILAALHGFGAL